MTTQAARRARFPFFLGLTLLAGTAASLGWAQGFRTPSNPPEENVEVRRPVRGEPAYKSDEVLVRFKPGASKAAVEHAHARVGGQVARTYSHRLAGLQLVRIPEGMTVREALRAYRSNADDFLAAQPFLVFLDFIPPGVLPSAANATLPLRRSLPC